MADVARRAEYPAQRRQEACACSSGPPLTLDPGMWLNMVNVKPSYLADLENVKKYTWDYKRVFSEVSTQIVT